MGEFVGATVVMGDEAVLGRVVLEEVGVEYCSLFDPSLVNRVRR